MATADRDRPARGLSAGPKKQNRRKQALEGEPHDADMANHSLPIKYVGHCAKCAVPLPVPCPTCGAALSIEDWGRQCSTCRSNEGTFGELWTKWECIRKYGSSGDQLKRFEEWPLIQELSCRLFGHAVFTQSTWERLEGWLLAYHVKEETGARKREAMLRMQLSEILRVLRTAVESSDRDKRQGEEPKTDQGGQGDRPEAVAQYLTSWREILVALTLTNNQEDKQKVSRLNKSYSGPIKILGQGKQPFVDKAELLGWWTGLKEKVESELARQRDAQATVANRHDFGRDSEVFPDIAGGVHKQRNDRQP